MQDGKMRYSELNHILEFNLCLISSELFSWRWVAITMRSSRMWWRVVLQISIRVSEERSVSIFREEDGGIRFIRNVGIFVYQLMASHPRRSQSSSELIWCPYHPSLTWKPRTGVTLDRKTETATTGSVHCTTGYDHLYYHLREVT
jgi:hypothetical protein